MNKASPLKIETQKNIKLDLTTTKVLDLKTGLLVTGRTKDYEALNNKPRIESVELIGNRTFKQLGISTLSVQEIEKILYL